MNQFFSVFKNFNIYKSVVSSYIKNKYNTILNKYISVQKIKPIDGNKLSPLLTLMKYYIIKSSFYLYNSVPNIYTHSFLMYILNNENINTKDDYYLQIYNDHGIVKTICYDTRINDILILKNYVGTNKFFNLINTKIISEIYLRNEPKTNILDLFANFCEYNSIIRLRDILTLNKINFDNDDIIVIKYIDMDSKLFNNDPENIMYENISNYIDKNIFNLL